MTTSHAATLSHATSAHLDEQINTAAAPAGKKSRLAQLFREVIKSWINAHANTHGPYPSL